ncbi:signal peptidase I [Streptoverticillium reticulum]|uniref:signal peptidase I n=1 Tax=Streptoverticillium reticulum TaxID=1433415 RepID=UPI0039BEF080
MESSGERGQSCDHGQVRRSGLLLDCSEWQVTVFPRIFATARDLRVVGCRAALAALAGLALWALLPTAVGWEPTSVVSGSMTPNIRRGDVAVSSPASSVRPGQVITFHGDQGIMTHRVTAFADGRITTKGDHNQSPDPDQITMEDVIGLGRLRVPYVGYPAAWLHDRQWDRLGLCAGALVAVVFGARVTSRSGRAGGLHVASRMR